MGYPNHARIEREMAVNAEVERCASIMAPSDSSWSGIVATVTGTSSSCAWAGA